MRKLFNSQFKVTQGFGLNSAYYSKFDLNGHEGIDLIPTGSDWTVLCPEDGVVVKDIDMADKGGVYGIHITLWHPSIKKATMYCHLSENYVKLNQELTKGTPIGKMGNTGNTEGAHVHINLFDVDVNGVRLNKNNGYLGGTDPLPFLQESDLGQGMMTISIKDFERIRGNSEKWDKVHAYLELSGDPFLTAFEQIQSVIAGYKSRLKDVDNQLMETKALLTNKNEELARKQTECQSREKLLNSQIDNLKKQLTLALEPNGELLGRIEELQGQVDARSKEIGNLKIELAKCRGTQKEVSNFIKKFIEKLQKLFKKK